MSFYVTSTIKPAGNFPTFQDVDGYGGLQVRANLADINNIPPANRKVGMLAYSVYDGYFYQLSSDLTTWSVAGFNANRLQGQPISSVAPANGQVLVWNNGIGKWEAQSATGISGSVQLAGDIGGTGASPKIIGIQGNTISSDAPGDGYIMLYKSGSPSQWQPTQFLDTSVAPSDGYLMVYTAATSKWTPKPSSALSLSDASSATKGVIKLAGDLSDTTGGTASLPKVTGIQGVSVDSTAPTDGYVMLYGSGKWKPTPFLDTTVNPLDGYVLLYSSGKWKPQSSLATASSTGMIQLAGDLAGTAVSPQVAKIKGTPVAATTPTDKQFLMYDSTSSSWKPATITQDMVAAGFSVTSFSNSASLQQYGITITPTFNCNFTYAPTSSVTISASGFGSSDTINSPTTANTKTSTVVVNYKPTTSATPYTSTTYTLTATYNGKTYTATSSSIWTFYVYYGVGDAWSNLPDKPTFITTTLQNKNLQTNYSVVGYTPTSAQIGSLTNFYVYYAYPACYGKLTKITSNGFDGGMGSKNTSGQYEPTYTQNITVDGVSIPYYVYVSENSQSASSAAAAWNWTSA